MLYPLIRPALFALDAEKAHMLSLALLKISPFAIAPDEDPILAQTLFGLHFPNPVGLAPGYDKNAEVIMPLFRLGFGFVEVGTLTPKAQAGNDRPRLFRLEEDRGVINRMGFNNDGQEAAVARLRNVRRNRLAGPLGINIGANKDSQDRIADYVTGVRNMENYADYITVNISSPNTPGLRALQDKAALNDLLSAVMAARSRNIPVFLKVAPDLQSADIDDIVETAMAHGVDALIVSNTSIGRPPLISRHRDEAGGLSGAPIHDLALQRLRDFRKASGGGVALIGVGGISGAADAYARIRAGASLVQLYSALVFEGPMLVRKINQELAELLRRDGFANIAGAVGADD